MNQEIKKPALLSATTIINTRVENAIGEDLGKIEELMIDLNGGCISYAVISFGGFLGLGNKLFAIPWQAIEVDTRKEKVILNVDKDMLKEAPGFDKDDWPNISEHAWLVDVYEYYGYTPYWK
ncbi:MAG: PRC-barrel domain-containing protein [Anaerolineaceae bacterium]|jgi:sporulation protein YlmC with PRC-barrel domain|nr:PRC-barrel domain-containing protein [Anaerolineaceae bacterium]